jgi:hypothetical protein
MLRHHQHLEGLKQGSGRGLKQTLERLPTRGTSGQTARRGGAAAGAWREHDTCRGEHFVVASGVCPGDFEGNSTGANRARHRFAGGAALAPLSAQAKAEGMKELRERALICMKCPNLASSRKNVVFGVGDIQAT